MSEPSADPRHRAKLFAVSGWSGTGKTTLTVGLITAFTQRGFTVATIKHTHHMQPASIGRAEIGKSQVDTPDTIRHRSAGAIMTLLAGPCWVSLDEAPPQPHPATNDPIALSDLLAGKADIVIAEGFKRAPVPKIVCLTADQHPGQPPQQDQSLAHKNHVLAFISHHPHAATPVAPVFAPSDIPQLSAHLMTRLGLIAPGVASTADAAQADAKTARA